MMLIRTGTPLAIAKIEEMKTMTREFRPSTESWNRLERFAAYAIAAGDTDAAAEAKHEFERTGTEDDCYHEDAG